MSHAVSYSIVDLVLFCLPFGEVMAGSVNESSKHIQLLLTMIAVVCLSPLQSAQAQNKTAAQKGQKLFQQLNCSSCHSVNDAGGCMGPPLAGVTKRRSSQYLQLRLSDTKEDEFIALIKHPELFPHPRFKPAQVQALLAYLKTLQDKPLLAAKMQHKVTAKIADEKPPAKPFKPAPQTASTSEGRRLFLEVGCLSCHSIGNTGGSIGPALDGIGARHSRQFVEAHITDPHAHLKATSKSKGKSRMVQADLFPDQVKAITDYLLTLPSK